ncbi:MAG: hypothetical protein IT380_12820 [Myxococcales bacterium]|nr:hypothetical protein [Myxococcales bacterium]
MSDGAAASTPAKKPLLERVGVRYFRARSTSRPAVSSSDAIHVLNAEERRALWRIQAGAVFRSALAGALSGGVSAAAEVVAEPLLPPGASAFSMDGLQYWAFLGGITLLAAVLEILFLYWDTLRSVHELARVAGLELFGKDRKSSDEALVDGLARAALELPNPIDLTARVNPHREVKKWRLVLASFAYKAKVGVTNFLVKMLVRRLLGRVAVRSVLGALVPFVAVPVTALWNALVTWKLLREARIRAMGPSALTELVDVAFSDVANLSPQGKLSAVRAVAAAIVRTQDLHPNLVRMLTLVSRRAGDTGNNELDDVGQFLASLKALAPEELRLSLQLLALALAVDGKLTARETRLWKDALAGAGRPVDHRSLESLRHAFAAGDPELVQHLRAV